MRRRSSLIAVLGLVSCRAPMDAARPSTEEPAHASPRPERVTEPAEAPAKSPPGDGAGDPGGQPSPPPLQVVVPVEVPYPPEALVVQAVRDIRPVVLFADETGAIRRRVADFFSARGRPVVPVEELERIEAAAVKGRLVLEGEGQCRAPISREEVLARYFTGLPRAEVEAQCYEGCALQVWVSGPDSRDSASYASGRVRRPHDPRAWARVKLRPTNTSFGVGGLGLFGSSPLPPILFGAPVSIGPWASPPADDMPAGVEAAAAACAHPDPRVGLDFELRVSVAPDGGVSRCTATSEHARARPEAAACLCQAIETLRHPSGRSGRRFRVMATDTGGVTFAGVTLTMLQPGTEPWVRRLRQSAVLSTCLSEHRPAEGLEATVVLELGRDGSVDEVGVYGQVTTPSRIALASCLVREASQVPLPCRPPGVEVLQVGLEVKAEPRR